jgi:hypothetical protein
VYQGDAYVSAAVADAIEQYECDALVHTAYTPPWQKKPPGNIVASVSAAAIEVGQKRGTPLRAWFIGVSNCQSL